MDRFTRRGLGVVGAAVFAVSLSVGGAGSAVAHPLGPIDSMTDLKGTWLTSLTGFREGDPIKWMHRLKVRKVLGSAAVAWEEWLDCEVHAADCKAAKAGKQTGVNWSPPSRVLMAMDSNGVVHGVGTYGSITLNSGDDGVSMMALSHGQRDEWTATPDPTTSGPTPTASRQSTGLMASPWGPTYVATGSLMDTCGTVGATDTATKNAT
jgi:hypothetical protein